MTRCSKHLGLIVAALAPLLIGVPACNDGVLDWSAWFNKPPDATMDNREYRDPIFESDAYRDSIAEYAYLDGLRRLRVRGYGIVAGLGTDGSSQCPSAIRQQLIQEMYKSRKFAQRRGSGISPEQLIDDLDTAVVAVEGEIPAAAPAGTSFDVVLRVLPGTQTTSLSGGWLYSCNLEIFRSLGAAGWIPGRTIATAAGPVFLNPFGRTESAATKTKLTEGVVIGGGISDEDRRIRLVLTIPSYQRAIAIAARINERFGTSQTKVADAVSPAEVRTSVPPDHRHDPKHFLAILQHLYLPQHQGFVAEKTRRLSREFVGPDAPHVEIALAWEGIGRSTLPEVQKFYANPRPACSFHAAAAGLRLGDDLAVETLAEHLMNPNGLFRQAAIRVLAGARNSPHAARPLMRVLDDPDPRIRVLAYEALIERGDPRITTIDIGGDSFKLDLVHSKTGNLIYARRTGQRRIALFGADIRALPPLFYCLPDRSLMIDAAEGATSLTIIRNSPLRGIASPPILAGMNVEQLIALLGQEPPRTAGAAVRGLGLDYGSVVLLLSEMCKTKSINAQFRLETPGQSTSLFSPTPSSRPESEL